MRVWFIPLAKIDPDDPFVAEHVDRYAEEGTLTTEHAASSYGQPVIVGEDGAAYGPGDVFAGNYSGDPKAPRDRALELRAAEAGFVREANAGETFETY